jgi:Ca-activated chloride channel family protein
MFIDISKSAVLFAALVGTVAAQRSPGMPSGGGLQPEVDSAHIQFGLMDLQASHDRNPGEGQESRSDSVSKLDLKAPVKAKKEYKKGIGALSKKDFSGAVEHLSNATVVYPSYVAAHNALGIAYMDLGQSQPARDEFQAAVSLDNHLPDSFANLCSAELAIGDYSAAQQAIERASSLAPLNLEFLTTLTFAELLNHQYSQVVSTAHQVHERRHESAAIVHYLAALASNDQGNANETRRELETFLAEDQKNPVAEKARQLLAQVEEAKPSRSMTSPVQMSEPTPAELAEQKQVVEAEAIEVSSDTSASNISDETKISRPAGDLPGSNVGAGWILRATVDEVNLLFAATDHGKSVVDLTSQDVRIRDNDVPPAAVIDFRSEAELPLRLGFVIDTSDSISSRFAFEQSAATRFLQNVLTNSSDDVGFLVGFANTVLLVQDFTADPTQLSEGIGQLAPAGGTALWDAVAFAARKLGSRVEHGPAAKILVVISDGDDNSSTETLKQAIQAAQSGQVFVYTISTHETSPWDVGPTPMGDRALKVLAEQTGGTSFVPGSVRNLSRSLTELQEVIRSRYIVSYKPAHLQLDGSFRKIDVKAEKSGRRLRVYSRKGYYATLKSAGEASF